MKKNTKLGVSNAILAAVIFLSGILHPIIMFGLIIYVLLFEEDEFSKLSAKRAIMIYVFFSALSAVTYIFDYTIRILITNLDSYYLVYNRITYLIRLAELLFYLTMAMKAFVKQDTHPEALDNKVESILHIMSEKTILETNGEQKSSVVRCANCGHMISDNGHFCGKCGAKVK